jgi:hypothetical protein
LRFEHAPSRIENGFCHPCLGESQTAHIADDDHLILINNPSRELMQGVLAAPCSLTVEALSLPPMTAPLGHRDLLLDAAVELSSRKLVPVTGGGRRL